jgi:hypothetical protein
LRSLSGKQAVSRQEEDVDASSGCAGSSPHLSPQHVLRLLVPALQRGNFAPQQRTKAAPSHNQFVDSSFKKSARDDASTCVMVNAQPRTITDAASCSRNDQQYDWKCDQKKRSGMRMLSPG